MGKPGEFVEAPEEKAAANTMSTPVSYITLDAYHVEKLESNKDFSVNLFVPLPKHHQDVMPKHLTYESSVMYVHVLSNPE
jgi:hypothetical protein